jgi:hypothetical protein
VTVHRYDAFTRRVMATMALGAMVFGGGLIAIAVQLEDPSLEVWVGAIAGLGLMIVGLYALLTHEFIAIGPSAPRRLIATGRWYRTQPLPPVTRVRVGDRVSHLETQEGAWSIVVSPEMAERIAEQLGVPITRAR